RFFIQMGVYAFIDFLCKMRKEISIVEPPTAAPEHAPQNEQKQSKKRCVEDTLMPASAPLDLKSLNERHLSASDKFFRMYAGAASSITAFDGGIISLDIHVDSR